MYERTRRAIDVSGHRLELIERQDFPFDETPDGATKNPAPRMMFTADGQQLIDDGDDFFRNPFGLLLKLID